MKRILALATGLFLVLPAIALAADDTTTTAEKKFDPSEEWDAPPVGSRSTSVRSTCRSTRPSPTFSSER